MMDLYIHQGKSLEEVMDWFKVNQDFAPRYVADKAAPTAGDTVTTALLFLMHTKVPDLRSETPKPFHILRPDTDVAFILLIVREHFKARSRGGISLQSMFHLTPTQTWSLESESYGLKMYRKKTCWQCYGRNVLQT